MTEYTKLIELVVNDITRVITIPNNNIVLGVVGDIEVNKLMFKMPRYYCGFDMSEFTPKINYVTPNAEGNYYKSELEVTDDVITFTWLLTSDVTEHNGTVKFSISLYKKENGRVSKVFNSRSSVGNVLEGLNVDAYVTPEQQQTILDRLETEIREDIQSFVTEKEASINQQITEKSDAAIKAIDVKKNDVLSTISEDQYIQKIEQNAANVGSLRGDLEDITNSFTSKNLLNPNRVTVGKRMYVDGSVHELDSDFYTDFIPVKPNQHIYSSYLNDTGNFVRSQMRHVCAYDANKTVLPSKGQANIEYDYLVPDGVAFIVVTFTENADIDHRQLEVSDSGITSFEKWFAPYLEPIEKSQVEQNLRDILETKIKVNENSSRISSLNDNLNDNIMPISNTSKGMVRKYNKGRFKLWKMPIEYDFVTPFNIFTDGNSFKTDFNAESYKNNYSNVKYLSPNGDDSGDGTIENPWKSFGKIREINGVTCYLKDGIYTVDNFSNWDGRLIGNFNLIGLGDVKIVNGDCPDNWEFEDGLYKTVCKSNYRACIDIETDVAGINYTKTDSLQECKDTKCSYFKTNEFIYINTSLDSPNKKIALIYNNMEKCFLIYAYSYDTTPYIKNIKWYGSTNSETENSPSVEFVSYSEQIGKSKAVFDNCGFYCGYVGVQTNQSAETIFYNCEAANVYTDGFQYFGESKNIEINCKGYGCGLDHIQDGGQFDNGSTSHGKCTTLRINSAYYGNNGGNCADALDTNSFSVCLGCSAFDSKAEITSQGFALQGGQLSRMYLECCTSFGNTYDIQSGANSTIKVKNCEYDIASENGGVITVIN